MTEPILLVDLDAILAEQAAGPHGLCPYCSKPGPVEARHPDPPHFAPHSECEAEEERIWSKFYAAEMRVSGVSTHKGAPCFATWGPGALLTYAPVAFEQLEGAVWLGAQPWWVEGGAWW